MNLERKHYQLIDHDKRRFIDIEKVTEDRFKIQYHQGPTKSFPFHCDATALNDMIKFYQSFHWELV